MRILVVEDDKKIASFVFKGLKEAGCAVDLVYDGTDALHLFLINTYDAAVVDIMLPGLDGLSLIRQLRSEKISVPIIILSAKSSVAERIEGLQAGGDDYLTKPFSFSELLARIHALVRRASKVVEPTTLSIEGLTMNLLTRKVFRNDQSIDLQPREFSLLEYLMRNAGRVVSKTSILERVYDYDFDPQTNVVDVLICRLRSRIDRDFEPKLIHTVRGVGYVLRKD